MGGVFFYATSISLHNAYMLASAWKIASETLNNFATEGITDQNIKNKLKYDVLLRDRYLVLWDMVTTLVELSQNIFALLATTARMLIYFLDIWGLTKEFFSSLRRFLQTQAN